MSDLLEQFEEEDLKELLEERFDAERFYKALSNALVQLENFDSEQAA